MSHYELTYILSAAIAETEYPALQKAVNNLIGSLAQGTITTELTLGRRKLAYPIKKEKYGHYVSVEFDAEPVGIKPLEHELLLNNSVLRHLLISKKLLSAKQQEEETARQAKIRARKTAAKMPLPEPERKPVEKITLDKLDEKLDELLEQDLK